MESLLLLIVLGTLAPVLWGVVRVAIDRRGTLPPAPSWVNIAETLGLTYHPPSDRRVRHTSPTGRGLDDRRVHRLTGTHRGIYVRVQTQEFQSDDDVLTRTEVRASLPALVANTVTVQKIGTAGAQLPTFKRLLGQGDIALGHAHEDRALEIRGPIPSLVRAVLSDGPVRSVLAEMTNHRGERLSPRNQKPWSLQIGFDHVRVESLAMDHVESMVEHAVQVAKLLGASMERVLGELGDPLGLTPEPDHEGSLLRLRGDFDEFSVLVRHQPGTERAMVRATLRGSTPSGLVVRHKEPEEDATATLRLGDPILDRMLATRGDDAESARALLVRDAVRGPLLTVLVDHGGTLQGNQVVVFTPDLAPPTLTAAVTEVVALARALSDRPDGD